MSHSEQEPIASEALATDSPHPAPRTSPPEPDWIRLQKALSVEAERGFNDLEGKQHRFSEFISLTLSQSPALLPAIDQHRWQELGKQFTTYAELSFSQRQHLVADTRRFLHHVRQVCEEAGKGERDEERGIGASSTVAVKAPKTTPLVEAGRAATLDQAVTYLTGIGPKNAEKLAKLGLITVRDVLFYYPRDHLDYARQVNIRDLKEGETVTLMGTVKRCTCFSSPRNTKLTILELLVRDHTGQIKLGRFFAGSRYSNRGWQEQQKRLYPPEPRSLPLG
jgi:ATP-dependent DNA helicase RecG